MEFGVLGPLRVQGDGGADVEIRRGISRTLLVALILRAPETITSNVLMELLWGDDQPRNPANALQIQISYLRKTLAAGTSGGDQPIVTRPGGYALAVDPDGVDALRFEELVCSVESAGLEDEDNARSALVRLDQALGLWRGEALADLADDDFAQGAAARLEEIRWSAHELRVDCLLALGRHRDAVGDLGELVKQQPLRERFHEQLILALYRCGRQADALRAYDQARQILVEELGLDPGPALQQLQKAVLAQDDTLDWQRPLASSAPGPSAHEAPAWRQSFVPAPITGLIGRDSDVPRLLELLGRSRLVTLTGPGGAGKTRLAIDLAAREAEATRVWYVDLSAVDLPELVAATVASAIGATTGPSEDPIDVVANALSTERALLVLDTCEHVLAGAASLASGVLRRAPGLRVLATSRRPLGLAGETAWPIPPLGVASPDADDVEDIAASAAVQLFVERARAVRPDFMLTDDNARDIARICLTLDGLPLAIELAAARADLLSPSAILERLNDRFGLLVDGAVDAAARQQTLRGAIDWSAGLLTEDQRLFFARLGVFAGTFDLAAAEGVAGEGTDDALALLSALVRHSMVVVEGSERFRLLDTLRAYANELLADLDADDTRRRHAVHFTAIAEASESTIRDANQRETLRALRLEIPNFRAALEWSLAIGELEVALRLAGSLAWFWALDGRLNVADAHLRRAIEIEDVPPLVRAKVLWGYALLVAALGDLEDALRAAELSTALARESGDDAAIGCGLNAAAVSLWALGRPDEAKAAHDEAIVRFVAAGDLWGEAICRVLRARTSIDLDEANADALLDEGLVAARACGDVHVVGIGLALRGQLHEKRGELDDAIRDVEESLELQESIGYIEGTISSLHVLARLHLAREDVASAEPLLQRSLRLAWKMQHAAAICEAVEGLAQVAARRGDDQTASRLFAVTRAERARRHLSPRPADLPTIEPLANDGDAGAGAELAEVVSELVQ